MSLLEVSCTERSDPFRMRHHTRNFIDGPRLPKLINADTVAQMSQGRGQICWYLANATPLIHDNQIE